MKKPSWYRRYCFMSCIEKKIQIIDMMGNYRFIGEWGNHIQSKYNMLIKHYNKSKFFWQKSMEVK